MNVKDVFKHGTGMVLGSVLAACGGGDGSNYTPPDEQALTATLSSIQANVFTPKCATSGCHNTASSQGGLVLDSEENSRSYLVSIESEKYGPDLRVNPSAPDNSVIIKKLEGNPDTGDRMPLARTPLSQDVIDVIREWITNGAED